MKLSSLVVRRQQHTGVLSDGMWSAHDRRAALGYGPTNERKA
jgi:hypothetical protein